MRADGPRKAGFADRALAPSPSPTGRGKVECHVARKLGNAKAAVRWQTRAGRCAATGVARLANVPGRVVTINHNGQALVQFEGADQGWHDIDPTYLKLEPSP